MTGTLINDGVLQSAPLSAQALLKVLQSWPDAPSLEGGYLLPANIATLHSYTHGSDARDHIQVRARLSQQLLAATLNFAAKNVPWYRRDGASPIEIGDNSRAPETLLNVPPVNRQLVAAEPSRFIAGPAQT